MPGNDLTQAEADALIAMAKERTDNTTRQFPAPGNKLSVPLTSADGREQFSLDLHRGGIDLAKRTYQNRARQIVVLLRLDVGGAPHRNPDGSEIESPHLHVFREGYADKWAFPLPDGAFADPSDLWQTLTDFMRHCNIVNPPVFQRGLET